MPMAVDNPKAYMEDRRRLLLYVLQVHQAQGGKLQLPIGMTTAEPWLLDAVDVPSLLSVVAAGGKGSKGLVIDLLAFCTKGTRTVTTDSKAHSRCSSRRTSEAAGSEFAAPNLQLPQLDAGLSEAEVKDLAYLVFATNCPDEGELLSTVRSQLDIDEARAAEVQRLLGLVSSSMREQAGPLPMAKSWTASLELPLCMLDTVLPKDFSRFRSFVMWRDTLSHVLLATLAQSVLDSWRPQQAHGSSTAQQLMARLKAALRRLDVRDADDFDEAEYKAASGAVRQQTQAIIQCTTSGWRFPWGLRVRLYEMLLRALFDSLDEAEYINEQQAYLQVLETSIRPLLGVAPSMHTAIMAWVHFRQFVITQSPQLLSKTKTLLYQLSQLAEQGPSPAAGSPAAATSLAVTTPAPASITSPQDSAFAKKVGEAVVDWIVQRLSDFHARLSGLDGPDSISGLVDLLAFAAVSRGANTQQVGELLVDVLRSSAQKELKRRLAADCTLDSAAQQCAVTCRIVKDLVAEEHTWTRGFASQMPEAFPVVLAILQEAAGATLLPWLSSQPVLDDDTCEALRTALELEPLLLRPIRAAGAGGCRYATTANILSSVVPWDMLAQVQPLLSTWLDNQLSGFNLWVDRQLQQEDWKPLGTEQPHSASSRELRRIAMESLEALFGLQLPVPPALVRQHMQAIAGMMTRYLDATLNMLGSETVMIPPTPHLTRYKREVAVKQEDAELQLSGMPQQLPAPGAVNRKGVGFLPSVKRVEEEPCASRVSNLSSTVLVVMMSSLAYLSETLQLLATTVKQMRQQEQAQMGYNSSNDGAYHSPSFAAGNNAASNPFLSENSCISTNMDDQSYYGPSKTSAANGNGSGSGGGEGADYSCRHGHSSDGGSSSGWGSRQQPPQQPEAGLWAGGSRSPVPSAGGVWPSGGSFSNRDEQLSSLHETGQRLRSGLAGVTRWLAVRVVWWQQRAGWCELLYRHRVTSCRIDWLLEGLNATLEEIRGMLPQETHVSVATAVLREAARALERALLDGGPCRWFIPADVSHIAEDIDGTKGLKALFYHQGVPMQDIRSTLLGVQGVLKLMSQQTGPLIEAHRAARRAALLAGPSAPVTPPAAAGSSWGTSPSSQLRYSPDNNPNSSTMGPLAAARLAAAGSQGSPFAVAAAAAANGLSAGTGPTSAAASSRGYHSRQPTGSSTSSYFDDAASYASSSSPAWGNRSAAAAGAMGGVGCMCRTAMDVAAAGGDVETQEPILLRVLCHRADHAASKYLKESIKVPKARDGTLGETFKKLTRLNKV